MFYAVYWSSLTYLESFHLWPFLLPISLILPSSPSSISSFCLSNIHSSEAFLFFFSTLQIAIVLLHWKHTQREALSHVLILQSLPLSGSCLFSFFRPFRVDRSWSSDRFLEVMRVISRGKSWMSYFSAFHKCAVYCCANPWISLLWHEVH